MLRAKIVTYRSQRKELENKHHDLLQRLADIELTWNDDGRFEGLIPPGFCQALNSVKLILIWYYFTLIVINYSINSFNNRTY